MGILDNVLVYDVETTIYKHQNLALQEGVVNTKQKDGSAFNQHQQLVMHGLKWVDSKPESMPGAALLVKDYIQTRFNQSSLIVGFNIKFDLHWARRVGIDITKINVWDCQLGEFILDSQRTRFPSMNQACEKYGFDRKLDVVKEDYWEKGLDTNQVPHDILREYLYMDLELTEKIFKQQIKQFKGVIL